MSSSDSPASAPVPVRADATGGVRPAVPVVGYAIVHLVAVPALLAAIAWTIQYGSLDLDLARLFRAPAGNVDDWRHSFWLELVGHQAARALPILVGVVAMATGIAGFFVPRLASWRRVLLTLGAAMIVGPALINWLKSMSMQYCPAATTEFGGSVDYLANRASGFWARPGVPAGRCLPSAHAGGGYALLALYFAGWAAGRPAWRWSGLAIGIGAGLAFAVVRMIQGAHFASATVWSATVAWTVCAVVFMPLLCRSATRPR